MARLSGYVHVRGEVYGPADDVPADIARLITNPDAWEGGALPTFAAASVADPGPAPAPADEPRPAPADEPVRIPAPPRSGRGSGLDAWQAYAHAVGLDIEDNASRDDIIAAATRAGLIAE